MTKFLFSFHFGKCDNNPPMFAYLKIYVKFFKVIKCRVKLGDQGCVEIRDLHLKGKVEGGSYISMQPHSKSFTQRKYQKANIKEHTSIRLIKCKDLG